MSREINFMVAGEAGQGVQSVGFLLAKAFSRGGFHVFGNQDYESRVRGGHNFFRVRVKEGRVRAINETVDVLLALNKESIDLHRRELADGGVVIFDNDKIATPAGNGNQLGVPLEKLAEKEAGGKLMTNTVALGAGLGLTGYDFEIVAELLREHFPAAEVGKNNVRAARAGYDYARNNFEGKFDHQLHPVSDIRRMLLTGNEALTLGAIAAGCKFMAAYPMTPASSIMEYFAAKAEDLGLVMVPAEDEISAMNMIVGASYAGVRALTATSGSGFCLMVEGLGMAGITETPIVVVDAQRPGPAVGLPTRTEQGDLEFVLHAHHGEFPRAVLAPATIEDAFWSTVKAFNLADRYQLPVIILTDQHLASSYGTVDKFDMAQVTVDRGDLFTAGNDNEAGEYKRHRITRSGISPRAFPGQSRALVITDTDEHNEEGHLIEDGPTRTAQVEKRLRKLVSLKQEISPPVLYGPKHAETTLIGWGSTRGAISEAVDILRGEGREINSLHFNDLWPFPGEEVADAMDRAHHSYVVENNATGQLARLIARETGRKASGHILKYDGRPFTPAQIAAKVREGRCDDGIHS